MSWYFVQICTYLVSDGEAEDHTEIPMGSNYGIKFTKKLIFVGQIFL